MPQVPLVPTVAISLAEYVVYPEAVSEMSMKGPADPKACPFGPDREAELRALLRILQVPWPSCVIWRRAHAGPRGGSALSALTEHDIFALEIARLIQLPAGARTRARRGALGGRSAKC